ncbi:MAG: sigma-70 family RNA polymerase sigma factor [Planctomycetota bacterium]
MLSGDAKSDALFERLRGGDDSALAPLFSQFEVRLKRMVSLRLDRRLGARVSPSDVLQETYLAAVKRLRHLLARPDAEPYLWFRSLTLQRLIDLHRQHLGAHARSAEQEVSLDQSIGPAASSMCLARALIGEWESPSQAAIRDESLAQLEQALEELEPLDREVLALRHFEELDNGAAAEVIGISQAATSKRYLRALARLRTQLEKFHR